MSEPPEARDQSADEVVTITDVPESSRFEISLDGTGVGFADYATHEGLRVFTHTEIDEAHGGQGLATLLIQVALDETREAEIGVLPVCPAVQRFIGKHPDYVDVVPPDRRAGFGL